ncbi:polysaccharide biosynthesis protein [Bifidobacterium thermophilum]|uniref:Polysaccharide biosynthesis protein n=2 Tax=Bifidobacterium thermophilum TaxID=33905 RepID=A0A2N3QPD4_9BIFI|nr:polysaccharide biosynthesis protein [Bifidobacterium thermophilum]
MGKYRNLAINVALFTANAVATKLISFFLVPLYTYYMSAGEYGITDMSLTVIYLVMPLATLDIAESAVRFMVGDRGSRGEYAAVAFIITVLSVVLVACLTPLLDFGVFGGLGEYKGLFVIAYATSAFMSMCGEVSRGLDEVKLIPICAVASSLVTLISAGIFIGVMRMGVTGYFISASAGPAVAVIIYLFLGGIGKIACEGMRKILSSNKEHTRELIHSMLRYSLPLIPNSLFWWLGSGINRLFITGMLGISASGLFAAASKIPSLLNSAYSVFQQAWQLSAFQESKKEGISRFFSMVFAVIQAGMTGVCAILAFIAPWLATLLLQGETFQAWPMIGILLISNLFNVFATFYGTVYSTTMHTTYIMKTTVFGAISCIVLTPALIPIIGTYGACIASAVGQALVFVMRALDSRRYLRFDVGWKYLIPTVVVLIIQSVLPVMSFHYWQIVSLICVVLVLMIQFMRIRKMIINIGGMSRLLKGKKGFHGYNRDRWL